MELVDLLFSYIKNVGCDNDQFFNNVTEVDSKTKINTATLVKFVKLDVAICLHYFFRFAIFIRFH